MTNEEKELLDLLGEAWNKFHSLEELHPADRNEFCFHIHALQNLTFARDGMREYGVKMQKEEKKDDGKILQYIKISKSMLEDIPDDGTTAIYARRAREGR